MSPRVSVLVPVNEAAPELAGVHRELADRASKLDEGYELIFLVRTDHAGTLAAIREIGEQEPGRVRVLQFAPSAGEAFALSAGVDTARGDVIVTAPARFETDLSALERLHRAVCEEGADVAVAARQRGGSGRSARAQSQFFNRLISRAAGARYQDIASGTRVIRRVVFDEIPVYGDFHRYLPILADRAGFRVVELPAAQDDRSRSPVVHSPLLYLWRAIDVLTVFFISRFTRHPLRLFGGVGSLFASVGVLLLLVIGVQRLTGTPLADRPILVLATLLIGLGVQAFSIGLLGELLLFFHARRVRDYRVQAVYEAETPALPASIGQAESPERSAARALAESGLDAKE
jgi:dolichol-phosphate mannosyltransferase